MSTATFVPIEEYLHTDYSPDCDYVDGELLKRNVGEFDHANLQTLISNYLFNRRKQWGITVVVEQRVQVKPTRFRVPDVTVLVGLPDAQIIRKPPFLCIEILSPEDRMTQMQKRNNDYLAFGVRYVWVVDPKDRSASVWTADEMRPVKDGVLATENPDIRVPLSELE